VQSNPSGSWRRRLRRRPRKSMALCRRRRARLRCRGASIISRSGFPVTTPHLEGAPPTIIGGCPFLQHT
jgi:hypothetical protein